MERNAPRPARTGLRAGITATVAAAGAASVLALAAGIGSADTAPGARASAAAGRPILETLSLLRWGHGAFHWLLPDETGGDRNDRAR